MSPPLEGWQERLEGHFTQLAATRANSGFPIFALEHGLTADEFADIANQLRSRLAAGLRLGPHWLLWVIYATEEGYAYDGHEYWVSFEENTPGWREHASGRLLRSYFAKFQEVYNGVIPTGPWAGWFKNIAWPITHAILPRYLQLQFARALYESRHQLARVSRLTPTTAGECLASNAWGASSRFREFLEQVDLAGRIVLALLGQGTVQGQSPIFPATLERIVTDLEEVRRAGEWLKEARRFVADRFRGVGRGDGGGLSPGHGETSAHEGAAASPPNLRPGLLLRRLSAATWSAVLEIPDFGSIALLSPELTAFLKNARCRIAGVGDAPFPRGWLLSGAQKRVLKSWPSATASVVNFEHHNAVLDNLVNRECRISPGPVWLFRVGSDGIAREITGRIVRPGLRYVLVTREPLLAQAAFVSTSTVQCTGVSAVELRVPPSLTAEQSNELNKLGVQVARNIRLWPAGMSIRDWDGEGHGDWLTTETPCFGVVHDHPVDEYTLRLDNGPETTVDGQRSGHPIFVRLQPLSPGRHVLSVKALRVGTTIGAQALKDLEGSVELNVRDPMPWIPGTTSHSGLALSLDPPDPSLDAFWEGNVGLSLLGPEGRSVACSISLTRRSGALVLAQQIGAFDLPITPSTWAARFQRYANDDARAWQYLEASNGLFVIDGEELGRYAIPLEREGRPVRWICRNSHRSTTLRLIDDTGQEDGVDARFLPFRHPTVPQAMLAEAVLNSIAVEEPGGLYIADHAEHRDALVVSSSHAGLSLHDLLIEPELTPRDQSEADLTSLLDRIDLWQGARLAGPLADSRRDHIVRCLVSDLYARLCGSRWRAAEDAFLANAQSSAAMQQLEKAVGGLPGFSVILRRDYDKADADTENATKWFTEIATRYGVTREASLCSFALRIAAWPFGMRNAFPATLDHLLQQLRAHPILLRGARLATVLAISRSGGSSLTRPPRWA